MRNTILYFIVFVLSCSNTMAQEEISSDTLYKSLSSWQIKLDNFYGNRSSHDTTDFHENQKIEILKSGKTMHVTIGNKVFDYTIVSSKRMTYSSVSAVEYELLLGNKPVGMCFSDMKDGTYYVNMNWEIGSRMVQSALPTADIRQVNK